MPDSKLIVRPPLSANRLDEAVWTVYDKAPRNSKSREMQRLLQGGMALQELGILDAVLAVALSGDLQIDRANPGVSVLQTITNAMQTPPGSSTQVHTPKEAEIARTEPAESMQSEVKERPPLSDRKVDSTPVESRAAPSAKRKLVKTAGLGGMMGMGSEQ